MEILGDTFRVALEAARSAISAVTRELSSTSAFSDGELLALQRHLSELRREIDASSAVVAGEVGHRSRRELGYGGLAQREGFRTPEALIRHTTGSTAREAAALVRVGGLVHDATEGATPPGMSVPGAPDRPEPWFRELGSAVLDGTLSVEAAHAIGAGLGSPIPLAPRDDRPGARPDDLALAAHTLLVDASLVHADELFRRARAMRDALDETGIADRERAAREARSVRRTRRPNGLPRYVIDLDIESAAFWDDVYDTLTSPRRGGVRFVDDADRAWAGTIATDERTIDQYAHDAFTQLLRIAVCADTGESRRVIGSRQPSVRVLVTHRALESRLGHGRIEGSATPVSLRTVERIACASGTIRITFDEGGHPLDLGREHRLYSARQRIALAARDGGCLFGECDRPPSWCEAHHIRHWKRDDGSTDVADGVLLCRHHHLLVHNNGWEIERDDDGFWLIPPREVDPGRTRRAMPSKSAALRDLLGEDPDERGGRRRGDHHPDERHSEREEHGGHGESRQSGVDDDPGARHTSSPAATARAPYERP
jgi:hypothetical protein